MLLIDKIIARGKRRSNEKGEREIYREVSINIYIYIVYYIYLHNCIIY